MAFQFVPNAEGSFDEGDRQTNPETGVEYIFTDGAWRALGPKIENEFDTLDDRYIKLSGTTELGDYYRLRGPNETGDGTSTFQVIDEGLQYLYNIANPTSDSHVANQRYVKEQDDLVKDYVDTEIGDIDIPDVSGYLPLSGGTLTDMLKFNKGNKAADQFKIIPNASEPHTNIYTTSNGQLRLRTSHTGLHTDNVGSHIVLDPNDGVPETKIYNVVETNSSGAVPKSYVDDLIEEKVAEAINDLLAGGLPDPPAGEPAPPPVVKPAFLSWIYDGEKTDAESPASGHFNRHTASTGNNYMRFSFNTNNGIGLGDGKFADTNQAWSYYGPVMSIWEWITINNMNKFKLKRVFYCETLRWNYIPTGSSSAHFEVKISSGYNMGHTWSSFDEGSEYFVTMGGVF